MKLYNKSNLGTRDKVIFKILKADSLKYATINIYASIIKGSN